jgi:hypothetical protein
MSSSPCRPSTAPRTHRSFYSYHNSSAYSAHLVHSSLSNITGIRLYSAFGLRNVGKRISQPCTSPNEYDTEMPDEAGKPYAKQFLVQQWMRQGEDERRGDLPPARCQSPETLGPPRSAGSLPTSDSAGERDWGVTDDCPPSLVVRVPEEHSTLISTGEMNSEPSIDMAVSSL